MIVQHYLKIGDYNKLISTCKRLGEIQPSLWLQALTGLRDDESAPLNLLYQVLHVIGKLLDIYLGIIWSWILMYTCVSISAQEKLQSPLQILLCLSVENGPNLSAVREYFLQTFLKNNESVKTVIISCYICLFFSYVNYVGSCNHFIGTGIS